MPSEKNDYKCIIYIITLFNKIAIGGANLRNYKKEIKWSKEKYEQINARIEKELGQALKEKLKQENKTLAEWTRENAKKYLEED